MSQILQDFSSAAVAAAIEANAVQACKTWARWPKMEMGIEGELVWTLTDVAFPLFNNVFARHLELGRRREIIETAVARVRSRGVPLAWWVGPTAPSGDLGTELEARGLEHTADLPAMAVDIHALQCRAPSISGSVVTPVADAAVLGLAFLPATLVGLLPGLWIGHRIPKPRLRTISTIILTAIALYALLAP